MYIEFTLIVSYSYVGNTNLDIPGGGPNGI